MNHYYNNLLVIQEKLAGNIVSATAESQRELRGADLWSGSRYDADELLVFTGADFIDVAYRALLKRAPDQSGFAFYSHMLEQGISRKKILGVLRYSPEGRRVNTELTGLRPAIFYRSIYGPRMLLKRMLTRIVPVSFKSGGSDES